MLSSSLLLLCLLHLAAGQVGYIGNYTGTVCVDDSSCKYLHRYLDRISVLTLYLLIWQWTRCSATAGARTRP